MPAKKRDEKQKRHRSADTGKFVTERYAKRHQKTTVSETVKPRKRSKK
jgi:hypothetical protein